MSLYYCLKVLSAGDDAVGLEQIEEDEDGKALQRARRSAGSMSAMSGAKGMVYMEYRYDSVDIHPVYCLVFLYLVSLGVLVGYLHLK